MAATVVFSPAIFALNRSPNPNPNPNPRFLRSSNPLLHCRSPNPKPLAQSFKPSAALISPTVFSDSTRTISSLISLSLSLSRLLLSALQRLPAAADLAGGVAGPLFFARLRDRPSGYLNTPLTVVAAGMTKWLDIYSGILMVRVLLSWFPNIPWERQPLCAIRDLCDPYLNLFRNIIPPVFDTLDVSPLLAFAVLGALGSILHSTQMIY